jgi:hypothetical protein
MDSANKSIFSQALLKLKSDGKNFIEYTTDVKGSTHFYFPEDESIFTCYTFQNGIKYLKCIESNCECRAKVETTILQRMNKEVLHKHSGKVTHRQKVEFELAYEKLRENVKNFPSQSIRSLHYEVLRVGGLSRISAALLEWKSVRGTLQRIRHSSMPSCSSLKQLEAHLEDPNGIAFQTYGKLRETDFYQGSIGGQLIFANLELSEELPSCFSVFIDGTFGITPFNCRQLLVVMAELRYKPRPIAYALMKDQTTANYEAIFQFIQHAIFGNHRKPIKIMSDFEPAILAATKSVWPGVSEDGCNFHYKQALRRYVRQLPEISRHLLTESVHNHVLSMFMALSMLPANNIQAGYRALVKFIGENSISADYKNFLKYFQSTWMVRYQPQLWSVAESNKRTNNDTEGHNNKIKRKIPKNPSAWVFLEGILDLAYDASSSFDADTLKNAPPPKDKSKITASLNSNLLALHLGEIDEMGFLERMSSFEVVDDSDED